MNSENKLINKPLLIIVAVYLLTFMACVGVLTWDNTDEVAIYSSYLVCFGVASVINYFVLRTFVKQESRLRAFLNLAEEGFKAESEIIGFVDNNMNYRTGLYCKEHDETIESPVKHQHFGELLIKMGLSAQEAAVVENWIKGHRYDRNSGRIHIKNHQILIDSLIYQQNAAYLKISRLGDDSQLCLFQLCYRITEQDTESNSFDIPVFYFEIDRYNNLVTANKHTKTNFGISSHEITSSIIGADIILKQEDLDMLQNSHTHLVQKLTNIHSVSDPNERYLLVGFKNDAIEATNIKCVLFKLNTTEVSELHNELEETWVEHSWKYLFDKSPFPVCWVGIDRKVMRVNAPCVELLRATKCENADFESFFEPESAQEIRDLIDNIVKGTEEPRCIPYAKVKGGTRIFEVFPGKLVDYHHQLQGFLVRILDVTQQRQIQETLTHAQRMQTVGQLVGSVAHDFNNILTAISGFCDLLLLRHGIGDPSFFNIMQIKQSADRASSLVRRLLAFSRKQTLQLATVSPVELFSEFAPLIQRLIGSRIKLTQTIDPHTWWFRADTVQMEQVFLNLVVNAEQAMGDEGELQIVVSNLSLDENSKLKGYIMPGGEKLPASGDYVMISIKDTGAGIPKENLKQIFEPFFTTKAHSTGTGLGLATVYGVVRQSEGHIMVKSKIGKGTEFLLLFPKAEPVAVAKIEETEDRKAQLDTLGTGTIVLVEDEDAIRIFAKNVLTNKGYNVIDFPSAKIAYEHLASSGTEFDLLITDVLMPEMNGPHLVTLLQKIKPDLRVIFISGYAEEAFTEEYGDSRDFNFLAKPFSLKQLLIKVKEVINSKSE